MDINMIFESIFIISILFSLWIAIFVYHNNKNNPINRVFCLSGILFSLWMLVNLLSGIFQDIIILKISYAIGPLLPTSTLVFALYLENKHISKTKIRIYWGIAAVFSFLATTPLIIKSTSSISLGKFDGEFGDAFWLWGLNLSSFIIATAYVLVRTYITSSGNIKQQAKYVSCGLFAVGGFCIISEVIFPMYGNNNLMIFDPLVILIYFIFTAYAIVKHQLMDIRIAMTRAGLFLLVYSFVLGLPFLIGYKTNNWFLSTISGIALASFGFLVYTNLRISLEKMLFHKEKLEIAQTEQIRRQRTMDTFSASMAHEIINPVYAIIGLSGVIKEKVFMDLKDKIDKNDVDYLINRLDQISELSSRIEKMIKAIREFSSQTTNDLVKINLKDVIDGFVLIVGAQFKSNRISLMIIGDADIFIKGNKILLEEALVNLGINAVYALKTQITDSPVITLRIVKKENIVRLIMEDNGCGIPGHLLEDIFLDFVTTKGSSEGLGMGLSRARKIIQLHQGKIWAESDGEYKGAKFCIELPVL